MVPSSVTRLAKRGGSSPALGTLAKGKGPGFELHSVRMNRRLANVFEKVIQRLPHSTQ